MRHQAQRQHEPAQGGGTQTPPAVTIVQTTETKPANGRVERQEVDSFTMRLIGRYGSAENALTHIAGEQLKYRRRAQDAETERDELKAKLPTAGSVILSGDEAKAFAELTKADGKFSLVTLAPQLKELGELKTKSAQQSRADTLTTAAGKRYNPKVLARLIGDLAIEFKTVLQKKEDGEDGMEEVKVAYIKNGDVLELLDTWLEREHKEFMDVVKVKEDSEDDGNTSSGSSTSGNNGSTGPTMPKQTVSSGTGGQKGKDAELLRAVDRSMSGYLSPSQRRKAESGSK